MLAWILKTKPEKGLSRARSFSARSKRGIGGGASSATASRSARTPKLVSAEPTKTGVLLPAKNEGKSTLASIASSNEHESSATFQASPSSAAARSASMISSGASAAPRAVRVYLVKSPVRRSIVPRKSPGCPTGHVAGVARNPICCSTSSSSSRGSRPGRSNLLKNVSTGKLRERHTLKSFNVWASIPLAVSSTMMTASTAAKTRYVSSLKSRWPGVSSKLKTWSPYGNCRTVDEMEMPRWRSISIQSDVAERCPARARTEPAS